MKQDNLKDSTDIQTANKDTPLLEPNRPLERRKLLKLLAASGGAIAVSTMLPTEWIEPVVEVGVLPAHAQISTAGGAAGPIGCTTCGTQVVAGGDTPDVRTICLGKTTGTFRFEYNTLIQQDQIRISYEGVVIFDSGCVGTGVTATAMVNYGPGTSTEITVEVIPNCAGGFGTLWDYTVFCP